MTQKQKDLLLKDLCARLPYGVKVQFSHIITSPAILKGISKDLIECDIAVCELEDVKPYLFPLESMTEEQEKEYNDLNCYELGLFPCMEAALDYLIENHFDYRYLIDEGLAIDATGLNIY